MRDVTFLHTELERAKVPGLDSLDPRFSRINDLAEKREFEQAAAEVHALLDEKIYDIRLMAFYLFQVFLDEGVNGAGMVVGGVESLLDRNWDALGPEKNREKYVEKSLTWLFGRIADTLEYHKKKNDARYRAWRDAVDPVAMDVALEAAQQLVKKLVPPTYPHAGEGLGRVLRELRAARETAIVSQPPPPPEEVDTAPEVPTLPPSRSRAKDIAALTATTETVELRVSPHFIELCLKLRAFETLIEKRNFEKAAMVSDDLMGLLDSFDPRKYFPELFATFSNLLSSNVSALSPHWDRRETLEFKTLQQFYRVDLKSFVGE